ncbi:hypothetical protein [Halorubrum sp. JWXQ-INN 858]|uniref:DUF7467 domain-containing protein n=1 Tax=Halorubrum sp. JWXQ-INN 858 TaxID=2690782 RepID=UPI00190F2D6B|nr:hypothetical protein [Halorubrum sp. JWXQ-INN 858]
MTDGRGSGADPRPIGVSRRRLLAGLGGVGAVGMAGGAGTFAHFSDAATFPGNELGAGEVELVVNGSTPTNGVVGFGVDRIDRGDAGVEAFDVAVRTNPARLWLATRCPEPDELLAEFLQVTLSVGGETVFPTDGSGTGSLGDLNRAFVAGIRLDEGCLAPEPADLRVTLTWELPVTTPDAVAGRDAGLELRLYTEQCRHVDEADADASNPFAGVQPCPGRPCVICEDGSDVKLQSLTLRYLGSEATTVVAVSTGGGAGGVGTGGTVVFDGAVEPGETFLVDATTTDVAGSDGNWLGPNVFVDDGSGGSGGNNGNDGNGGNSGNSGNAGNGSDRPDGVKIHTSCSETLAPGDVYGDFEVVAGTTTEGELLCDPDESDGSNGSNGGGNGDPDPHCGVCDDDVEGGDGPLRDLTFRYDGGASATVRATTTVTGPGGDAVVFGGEDGASVAPGSTFTADGSGVAQSWKNGVDSLGPNTALAIVEDGDDGADAVVEFHTSCSDPIAVGDTFGTNGSGGPLYELVAGTKADGEPLCGSEDGR